MPILSADADEFGPRNWGQLSARTGATLSNVQEMANQARYMNPSGVGVAAWLRFREALTSLRRPLCRRRLAPQPAQRIGQDRPAVLAVVAAVAPLHVVVVLLVLERRFHLQIAEPPVAVLVVQVGRPVLKEDADGFVLGLADDAGIAVAAADVREAADVAEHFAEEVRPLPGDGESANA